MTSPTRPMHYDDIPCEKHHKPRSDRFLDVSLFTSELLITEKGLQAAQSALDNFLWEPELMPLESMVRALMTGPTYLLEYTIAVVLDECRYDRLISMLLDTFPSLASTFSTSLAAALLARLREFYIRLVSPDLPRSLDAHHRTFPLALKALSALDGLQFAVEASISKESPAEIDGIKFKQSQRKTKSAKRQSRTNIFTDDNPFAAIDKDVPCTEKEADQLAEELLAKQKCMLQEYLATLRDSQLTSTFEALYVLPQSQSEFLETVALEVVIPTAKDLSQNHSPEVESHPAYPQVQPLKAAKYFSEPAEGFGPWNLLLSSRAIQHLKKAHRDQEVWRIVKKKMQQLSEGFFSDSNQKRLIGNDQDIPIYEAKLTRDLRIIYQVDLAPNEEIRKEQQVLRIWGIHTHAQMDKRLWKAISQHHTKIGQEYRHRCLFRETPKQSGCNIICPASWSTTITKLPMEPVTDVSMSTEEQLELHSILALEKFTRMSQALLNNIIADQDAAHPFELTVAEQEIRDCTSSCFVLGRSGTGKTTTMVFKMMNYEMLMMQQAAQKTSVIPARHLRQLFVTQSRILATRVQEYFSKMMLSHATGHKAPQELERLAQRSRRAQEEDGMLQLDEDGENDERPDLPKKFSELQEYHFPLFLTMDQLCKLLEGDCNLSFNRGPRTREHHRAEQKSHSVKFDRDLIVVEDDDLHIGNDPIITSPTQGLFTKASIITFDVFLYAYWPHFPQSLTKNLDPALVFNEFMGVIKGSEETLEIGSETNHLQKQTYLNYSSRRQSTFSKQRERVYQLFEFYNKRKRDRGDYDAADRTHAILRVLEGKIPFERKVDYLYVDEVQDNLIIDALMLRLLCGNPHGLFWAGDTAQTISMGSSFRFEDLKAFLHRIEARSVTARTPIKPASFQLDVNYRSHAGVVDCAHSVVGLISKFWPDSIDALSRERGLVEGPRPVFFSGWDAEAASFEQFLFHESAHIELGAQQCILVRNDQAREELRSQIGEVGLVMTLYESKGLEFNDVLLYNFFSDSTATLSEWRMVLNAVEEDKRGHIPAPEVNEDRHILLCSELKSLYVGITRARSHVWIFDTSEKGEPMRVFWGSQKLIEACRPGDPLPKLAVKSTPEQWAQQGYALFKTKHFKHAILCFERAGFQFERSVAHAHLLRQSARQFALQSGHGAPTQEAFLRAAESFVVSAGLSSSRGMRLRYLAYAGDCYSSGARAAQAAQAYLCAERFTQAAEHFKKARLFDEAADVVILHRCAVNSEVAEQCISIAKLHLHREGQLQKAARLFDGINKHLLYLEDYGFDKARTTLLESLERWADAAELHYQKGQHFEAISLWLRAGDLDSKHRAGHCLLDHLWKTFPLGASPKTSDSHREKRFELIRTLNGQLDKPQREECAVFTAILEKDNARLLHLAHDHDQSNPILALLCYDHVLCEAPRMQNESAKNVSRHLEDYDHYAQLMRPVITDWRKAQAAALLGLVDVIEDPTAGTPPEIHVLSASLLYEPLKRPTDDSDEHTIVHPDRLAEIVGLVLGGRLRERLAEEHKTCLQTQAFRWCVNNAVTGICTRVVCPREHSPRESLDVERFNLRVRLHMQQIVIVHGMSYLVDNPKRRGMQRIWQERLYDAVFPPYFALGHISALVESSIPEYHRALRILSGWTHDRFYYLNPRDAGWFLTEFVQTITLAYTFDRPNATHYVRRADCVVGHRPAPLVRKEGYVVNDLIEFFESSSVASGTFFIKHVLDNRVPIDINTLLNVLEIVIGQAIVSLHNSLDGLTLPRSWLVHLLSSKDEQFSTQNVWVLRFVFHPLRELAEAIYTHLGVDHLKHEGRSLSQVAVPPIGRNVFIFRIYKCITLLGYNYRNLTFRAMIQDTVTSLNSPIRTFGPLIYQYVKAGQWRDLARVVRISTDSPLDELISMSRNDKLYHPLRGVRLIRYNHGSDILPAVAYKKVSKFNPEAAPFVPISQRTVTPVPEEDTSDDESVDNSLNDAIEAVEVAPNDFSVHRTEAEIDACKVIQRWYRSRLAAKTLPNARARETRSGIYATSQKIIDKLQVSFRYRCMYLGPLPHVLTALQGCRRAIAETRKEVKKRIHNYKIQDLDRENEMIKTCNRLQKIYSRLWKDAEPTSELHHQGSVEKLKKRVEEISDLIREALVVVTSFGDFAWDLEVGYKGIVRVAAPPQPTAKAPRRPSLNTEDLVI